MAIQRFRKATLRIIAEIGMGTGALAVAGGTTGNRRLRDAVRRVADRHQGYASLGNIGVEAFTGFVAALANVRVVAPLVAGFALAATVGAGATAELGAMRISGRSTYLEGDGYQVDLLPRVHPHHRPASWSSSRCTRSPDLVRRGASHRRCSTDAVDRYLRTLHFRVPAAGRRVLVLCDGDRPVAMFVMINHCYYGFNASGGRLVWVRAVGISMRASLIAIALIVLLASLALYGTDPNFNLTVLGRGLHAWQLPRTTRARHRIGWWALCSRSFRSSCWFGVSPVPRGPDAQDQAHDVVEPVGLVMDRGSKVTYNGVAIGRVSDVLAVTRDGKVRDAELTLQVFPRYISLILANVEAQIGAVRVNKFYVSFTSPKNPVKARVSQLRGHRCDPCDHRFNTLFETITSIAEKVDPVKLNMTLSAA